MDPEDVKTSVVIDINLLVKLGPQKQTLREIASRETDQLKLRLKMKRRVVLEIRGVSGREERGFRKVQGQEKSSVCIYRVRGLAYVD